MKLFEGSFRFKRKEELAETNFWGFSKEVMLSAKKRSSLIANIAIVVWVLTALLMSVRNGEGGISMVIVAFVILLGGLLISKIIASIVSGIVAKMGVKVNKFDYLAVTLVVTVIIVLISNVF